MTPGEFYIFVSIFNKNKKNKNEFLHDLTVTNSFLSRLFSSKKEVDINDYLINKLENKKIKTNVVKMSDKQVIDNVKRMFIAYGGDYKKLPENKNT